MASALFGKRWYAKPKEEHEEAVSQFKAAVVSSRSGTDEGIKQVRKLVNIWKTRR